MKHNWLKTDVRRYSEIWELTFASQELLKELLKAFRRIHQNPTVDKVIQGHQDIFGVPQNIQDLKGTINFSFYQSFSVMVMDESG